MLTLQSIDSLQDMDALATEWDELHARVTPRLPFSTYVWVREWWLHYRRDSLLARDELKVLAVRHDGGRLIAVAPMFLTHRPGRGTIAATELQFIGADGNVTEIRGVLCRPEDIGEVVLAISAFLKGTGEWDWVQWRGIRSDEQNPLPSCINADEQLDTVDYILDLKGSWEEYKSALPRNIKESIRKCYNSLKREGVNFELRVVSEKSEVEDAVRTFFRLHAFRADARDTVTHRDVFGTPADQNFLMRYCVLSAESGRLRIFQIVIGGAVVATRIGFVFNDEIYLYYSGYDPIWGRFSVMTTTVVEILQWAFKHELRLVNLSSGSDVSKLRWRPVPIIYRGGVEVANRLRSRTFVALFSKIRSHRKGSHNTIAVQKN